MGAALEVHAPGEADGNLYAYVSGKALQSVDPMGLDPADAVAIQKVAFEQTQGAVGSPDPTAGVTNMSMPSGPGLSGIGEAAPGVALVASAGAGLGVVAGAAAVEASAAFAAKTIAGATAGGLAAATVEARRPESDMASVATKALAGAVAGAISVARAAQISAVSRARQHP